MMADYEISKTLNAAFLTALLLTGRTEAAEMSLLDGISALEFDGVSADSLILATVRSALQRASSLLHQDEHTLEAVPIELRRVLLLASQLRHCFVLRILLRLRAEACAELLHLAVDEVEDALSEALQELPTAATFDRQRMVAADCEPMHPTPYVPQALKKRRSLLRVASEK